MLISILLKVFCISIQRTFQFLQYEKTLLGPWLLQNNQTPIIFYPRMWTSIFVFSATVPSSNKNIWPQMCPLPIDSCYIHELYRTKHCWGMLWSFGHYFLQAHHTFPVHSPLPTITAPVYLLTIRLRGTCGWVYMRYNSNDHS